MKGTSDGSKGSPGISKRWLNALTMAASHGSAEAANTSAASIKSASQTVLGSALGTVRPIKYPSARPIRVESMNHENADAENDTRCRDYLGHPAKTPQFPRRTIRVQEQSCNRAAQNR
jgi:autonomous glycyl radical cofactor GrcA